jgi:hypothetical protein
MLAGVPRRAGGIAPAKATVRNALVFSGVRPGSSEGSRREDRCFLEDERLLRRLRAEVSAIVTQAVGAIPDFAPAGALGCIERHVEEFFSVYESRPIQDNAGGSRFNDSLWLFLLARLFSPCLIMESGTYKGHSSWIFHRACPAAEIHSFDVDSSQLAYRVPTVRYHQGDWTEEAFPALDGKRALAYFDDHISQAQRVGEAYLRGFRWLIFDDNFPAHNLYATGGPPVPTLAMITDPALTFGTEIRWQRHGRSHRYLYRKEDVAGAKDLIDRYVVLPELAQITRYNPQSGLTIVKLVD